MVVFLEEDYYLAPDALHTLDALRSQKPQKCNLIVLGHDTIDLTAYAANLKTFSQVMTEVWISSQHFRGMALTERNMRQVLSCAEAFCRFDDYNYDWALMNSNLQCFDQPWYLIRPVLPRVLHVGTCGFHRKLAVTEHCHSAATQIKTFFEKHENLMFPNFKFDNLLRGTRYAPVPTGYGGWGDIRDQDLCLNMTIKF